MICKRCGKENSHGGKYCIYCGEEFVCVVKKSNKQKKTEKVLVVLIIILTVLFSAAVGLAIYKRNAADKNSSDNILQAEQTKAPVNDNKIESDTPETEEPEEVSPLEQDDKAGQKKKFLDEAHKIEQYAKDYLDTAENQAELNIESQNVFAKWDVLLNDVYYYLKSIMTESQFKRLEQDEIEWISEKEAAIEEEGANWQGGSGEPMAKNLVAISYTKERCYYLMGLID